MSAELSTPDHTSILPSIIHKSRSDNDLRREQSIERQDATPGIDFLANRAVAPEAVMLPPAALHRGRQPMRIQIDNRKRLASPGSDDEGFVERAKQRTKMAPPRPLTPFIHSRTKKSEKSLSTSSSAASLSSFASNSNSVYSVASASISSPDHIESLILALEDCSRRADNPELEAIISQLRIALKRDTCGM